MALSSVLRSARSLYTLTERLFVFERSFGDTKAHRPIKLDCLRFEDRIVPDGRPLPFPTVFVGSGHGDDPLVRVLDAESGEENYAVQPFGETFKGGHAVASADFNNDTIPDLLVSAGKGGGPRVRLYDGKSGLAMSGSPIGDFWAYEETFTGGVEVAAGDINGDGYMDAITVPQKGGGPRIRAFSGKDGTVLADFFAYSPTFTGGLHIATGDFNIDNKAEIVVAAAAGGGPRVSIFTPSGEMLPHVLSDFFAFDTEDRSGVYVAVADVNGDTLLDIVAGSGAGATSTVRVFNGRDGSRMADRTVFGETDTSGVRVASAFINNDRFADVVVSSGTGSVGRVKVYGGGTDLLAGTPLDDVQPLAGIENGVMIAAANDPGTETTTIGTPEINGKTSYTLERGQQFTLGVTITSDSEPEVPAGDVAFYARLDGQTALVPLGTASLTPDTGYVGRATLEVKDVAFPDGDFDIVVNYGGNGTFAKNAATELSPMTSKSSDDVPISTPAENCPVQETPSASGTYGMAGIGEGGVRLVDGAVFIKSVDLSSDGFGSPWSVDRTWTNAKGIDTGFNGAGWRQKQPKMIQVNLECIALVTGGEALFFDKLDGVWVPRFKVDVTLTHDSDDDLFILVDGKGMVWTYTDFDTRRGVGERGQVETVVDAAGNEIHFIRNIDGTIHEVSRSRGDAEDPGFVRESWLYDYITDSEDPNFGLLQRVTLRRMIGEEATEWSSSDTVRSVEYEYYDDTYAGIGQVGDLKLAVVKNAADDVIDTRYYRYYTADGSGGYEHGLKMAFGPRAYERLVAVHGATLNSITDGNADDFADHVLVYDTDHRVTSHTVAGEGCSACSGGQGTYTYEYAEAQPFSTGSELDDPPVPAEDYNIGGSNIWRFLTKETLPDSARNTVTLNANGQVMLWGRLRGETIEYGIEENIVNTFHDYTFQKFNANAQVVLMAAPSAVTLGDFVKDGTYLDGLNDQGGNYEYLADSAGLITTLTIADSSTASATAAGNVEGFVSATGIRRGETGTNVPQSASTFILRNNGSRDVVFPAATTVYRETNGTGDQTTSWAYTWQGSTAQPEEITTTLPTVTTAQNGVNSALTTTTIYDSEGNAVWHQDTGGVLSFAKYDLLTGAVTQSITDANSTSGDPFGTVTGRLALTTDYVVDNLGRTTKVTAPNGRVDYTVFNDPAQEVRYYPGWVAPTPVPMSPPTAPDTTGPITVSRHDRGRGYTETFTIDVTPDLDGNDEPDGSESFSTSDIQNWSRSVQNEVGQTTSSLAYFDLTGVTYSVSTVALGTQNTNYLKTEYAYGKHNGQRNKVVSAAGTITRTEYDILGRAVSEWVGTDDTPTTGNWSVTNTAGTNMVKVQAYEYDGGLQSGKGDIPERGDSNLTKVTEFPTGSTDPRVNTLHYDWRNRTVAVKSGVQSSESTSLNRPISYTDYDNLNQPITSRMFDGDTVTISTSSGVPNAPSSSLLRAKTVTSFDEWGRAYKTQTYSVDPSSGSVSSDALTSNVWFDSRGQMVKTSAPGGLVQKTAYDAAGRVTASYSTDGGSDSGYSDADDVSGDKVLEQTEYTYETRTVGMATVNGTNLIQTTHRARFHDETDTGALQEESGGSTVKARVSFMGYYYDGADRLVTSIDVGTNAGTNWSRPGTAGDSANNRADTVLRTDTSYDAAGRVYEVTDPMNRKSRTLYDKLGRTTTTFENYVDGTVGADNDKKTVYGYGPAGMTSLTAYTSNSTSQTTQWNYGFTSGSLITNDLVSSTYWPNASTGAASSGEDDVVTINALGQTVTSEDRNGNVHTLSYDVLGRVTKDAVTTLGSGVDGAVRRIETAYDTQGNAFKFTSYTAASSGSVVNEVQRAFNGLGQLTTEWQNHGGAVNTSTSLKVQYAYSEMASSANHSRLTSMTYPNGKVLSYNYASGLDASISRLSSMSDSTGTVEDYAYLGLGTVVERGHPVVDLTYIAASSGGDAGDIYQGLDRFGRVVDQRWWDGTSDLDRTTYTYDRNGNRTARDNEVNANFDEDYTYDGLNQLVDFDRANGYDQNWSFDGLGNWSSFNDDGTSQTRTHNAQNEITAVSGATSPAFDANGNMLTDETNKDYVYDAWNRLVEVKDAGNATVAAYEYDGLTRRIQETSGGATRELYYTANWQVIEERDEARTNDVIQQYVWSPVYIDAMVLRDKDTADDGTLDQRLWVAQDASFNVTALVNTSGAVVERFAYSPYGTAQVMDASFTSIGTSAYDWVYRHQGGRWSASSGLVHFRHRDLSTTLGRWLTNDPLQHDAGDSSLYRYISNNPPAMLDSMGMLGEKGPYIRIVDSGTDNETAHATNLVKTGFSCVDNAINAVENAMNSPMSQAMLISWFGEVPNSHAERKKMLQQILEKLKSIKSRMNNDDNKGGTLISLDKAATATAGNGLAPLAITNCSTKPTKGDETQAQLIIFRKNGFWDMCKQDQLGTMIHEFVHSTFGTQDHTYFDGWGVPGAKDTIKYERGRIGQPPRLSPNGVRDAIGKKVDYLPFEKAIVEADIMAHFIMQFCPNVKGLTDNKCEKYKE